MWLSHFLLLCSNWLYAVVEANTQQCVANNCLRAVRASAHPPKTRKADCSSYFRVTVMSVTQTVTYKTHCTATSSTKIIKKTVKPTHIPSYASHCSGGVKYSSACSCIGVKHATMTIVASTSRRSTTKSSKTTSARTTRTTTLTSSTAKTSTIKTIDTSGLSFTVAPSSCPPALPTGIVIGRSNDSFSQANGGLVYTQYINSQFVLQNPTLGANSYSIYVDMSNDNFLIISDQIGNLTLVLYLDGTFKQFWGHCGLEIGGTWDASEVVTRKRTPRRNNVLSPRQSGGAFCQVADFFCNDWGTVLKPVIFNAICNQIGSKVGAWVLGGVGSVLGLPGTIVGVIVGSKFGVATCNLGANLLSFYFCKACKPIQCLSGQLACDGKTCIDVLSNKNNCFFCGHKCPSGAECRNGQCTDPTCTQATCGSFNTCGANCFCFSSAGGTGFCGANPPCSSLKGCDTNVDCPKGQICSPGTCCVRSVCIPGCGVTLTRKDLIMGRDAMELYPAGPGPAALA